MPVREPRYSDAEFARRGTEIYDLNVRPQVDTDQNKGKFVLIDIETGDWEMDADEREAAKRLDARVPDAQVWFLRVGIGYVRRFGAGHSRRLS
jgi:hypothetical protein